ncbi:MAG: hypothetical protein AB7U18_29040 [Dehalococcoidia bacterium]
MRTLAAKVAPQRNTQYAALASALAAPELRLSPLGPIIDAIRAISIAGQAYLLVDLTADLTGSQTASLGQTGATSEFFWYHESVGGVTGPFLQPIETPSSAALPAEIVEARRYRGKTNELFSQVMINIARWSYMGSPSRLLDPLMGGGTVPFIALRLGLDAIGIERDRAAVESTDTYLTAFLREAGIRNQRKAERAGGGRRTIFTIHSPASGRPLHAALIHGDTREAPALLTGLPGGARADLLVTDLPYGIQHEGQVESLVREALPAWHAVAAADAVLALAWNATRLPRDRMIAWLETGHRWHVMRGGAWESLAHSVDRVIKRREVIVARRGGAV